MIKPPVPELVIPASGRASETGLPEFVEHGGEIANRHPADAIDSRLYGFVLPANRDLLDAYCDRLFNRPTDRDQHWEAATGAVLLNFVDIPQMGSTDILDRRLGVTREREAAIWFPVVDRRRRRFAWAVPYMFVDSALALAGGREVYGFPKQLGQLTIPREDTEPDKLSISTVTLERYEPGFPAKDCCVLTVVRSGPGAALGVEWMHSGEAFNTRVKRASRAQGHGLDDGGAFGRATQRARRRDDVLADALFFEHLAREDVPMLLLKQFRDAHVQGAACYQAVVLVDMVVSKFRGGGLLPGDYQVEVRELAGEPIARELGVEAESTPSLSFWMNFDFVVQLGHILWEAQVDRRW